MDLRTQFVLGGAAAAALSLLVIVVGRPAADPVPAPQTPFSAGVEAFSQPPSAPTSVVAPDSQAQQSPSAVMSSSVTTQGAVEVAALPTIDADQVLGDDLRWRVAGGSSGPVALPADSRLRRLAVIPIRDYTATTEDESSLSATISGLLTTAVDGRRYELFERHRLWQLLEEARLRQSHLVENPETAAKIGRIGKVDDLLLGSISRLGRAYHLSAWVVDARTTRISSRAWVRFWSADQAPAAVTRLINQLGLGDASITAGHDPDSPLAKPQLTVGDLFEALNPDAAFAVSLRVDQPREVYIEDQTIRFIVGADRDWYLTLLSEDAHGRVTLLLPNGWMTQPKIAAGQAVYLPADDAAFEFPILPPHGQTLVKVIATTRPLRIAGVSDELLKQMNFMQLNLDQRVWIEGEREATDDVAAPSMYAALPSGAWAAAELTIVTRGRTDAQEDQPSPASASPEKQPEPAAPADPITSQTAQPLEIETGGDPNEQLLARWRNLKSARLKPTIELLGVADAASDEAPVRELLVVSESRSAAPGRPAGDIELLAIAAEAQLADQVRQLQARAGVVAVVPNFHVDTYALPPTRLASVQWSLENPFVESMDSGWSRVTEQLELINTPLIGLVDASVDVADARLRDAIWVNASEITGNQLDDDGNGLIDDVRGFNFVTGAAQMSDRMTRFSHGSFVASIIAARRVDGAADVIGMAPNAVIVPAVALAGNDRKFTSQIDASGELYGVIESIRYVVQSGARIINMSFGRTVSREELDQINRMPLWAELEQRGIIVVAAAGNGASDNDQSPVFPASLPRSNIVSVMSVDVAGRLGRRPDLASGGWRVFTNYGRNSVHIAAPGTLILGAAGADDADLHSGTSYSAAMVTAATALVWGQHPDWDYKTAMRAVLESARPLPSLKDRCTTQGMLDLPAALAWRP